MKPANIKETLRYKNMVANLKSCKPHAKGAALLKEIAGGSQWRIDAVMEAIGTTQEEWKFFRFSAYLSHLGHKALEQAAIFGRLATMQALCRLMRYEVADPSWDCPEAPIVNNAFEYAVINRHYKVADYLFTACRAQADQETIKPCPSAMDFALRENDKKRIDFLLARGANASKALMLAIYNNSDLGTIKHLVAKGANVNAASQGFWTPFLVAIKDERFDVARYLLSAGADPKTPVNSATEAMHTVINRKYVDMLKIMLDLGMRPDENDITLARYGGDKNVLALVEPFAPSKKDAVQPPSPR